MPVITPLKTPKECFETLTNLYEKKDHSKKRDLKNKFQNINMDKDETIESLFINNSQVKYQLVSIDVVIDEDQLFQTVIDGIPSSWETFLEVLS